MGSDWGYWMIRRDEVGFVRRRRQEVLCLVQWAAICVFERVAAYEMLRSVVYTMTSSDTLYTMTSSDTLYTMTSSDTLYTMTAGDDLSSAESVDRRLIEK